MIDPRAPIFRLFAGLERKGPGSVASTLRALDLLRPLLPEHPGMVDMGCGAGAATLPLARALGVPITAVDLSPRFLAEVGERAAAAGLGGLVTTVEADFADPPFAPGSMDLLWSEGAIYNLGWTEGLRRWRPLLAEGGLLAATEISWLVDKPRPEAAAFWTSAYPAITTVGANRRIAEEAGFEVLGDFALPASDWERYYGPLLERCREVEAGGAAWSAPREALLALVRETEEEIEIYRRFGDQYTYVFYVLRRR